MTNISPARATAFQVLSDVAAGEYASDVLRNYSRGLDVRDAGLASQIVFGCLRYQAQLDFLISVYSGRNPEAFDAAVAIALRTGIFQLRYLERIPAHAAVHESVELVKRRKRAAAGLTNAVLRKVDRSAIAWPDLQTELSCPKWLLQRWSDHFGAPAARRIAEAALHPPEPYLRIRPGSAPPHGAVLEPTAVDGCFHVLSAVDPAWRLQDIGSQAIVPLLDLHPGHSYLDLCAAPGNKTLQALETPLSPAIACDISAKRIRNVPPVCPRVVLDATLPLPFAAQFDRIFIDAPCSGTGTLSRNPEIKWRVQEHDLAGFGKSQREIVSSALAVLAPSGKLVYATCSLEREENEEVVEHILHEWPGIRCEQTMWRLPGRDPGDGFYAAVLGRPN